MSKKDLYRVINEEVSKFNYLNMDSVKDEANKDEILNSTEFQARLIHDVMNGVVKFKEEYGKVEDVEDTGYGDLIPALEKHYSFDYNYNGKQYNLGMDIEGRNLPVTNTGQHIKGDYYREEEYPQAENIDYRGVDIVFWDDGEEIKMPKLNNNDQLKDKLVRSILGDVPQ